MSAYRPLPDDVPAVFTVAATGGPGLTPAEIRSSRLIAPSRGVRIRADVRDRALALTEAAVLATGADAVLSDVAAARWWQLPLPPWIGLRGEELPVSVAVAAGAARAQRVGVRGRRLQLPSEHVANLRGRGVTTPARTWLDCAPLIPAEHLVAMGDAALRRRLATISELVDVVQWARRRRGVRIARMALPLLDPGAESPGESIVRYHLVSAGLPAPLCNVDIYAAGEWLARADLAWLERRLIVEYDGVVHGEEQQRRYDAKRRNALVQAGWRVLTFTADDLKRPWLMVAAVQCALAS